MQKWTVKTNSDDAVVKRAIEFVSNEVFSSCGYVPQDSDGERVMEFIMDGSVAKQGYDLTITNDRVTIKGGDGNGVLYGAVDFIGEYINGVLTASEDIFLENAFESVFDKPFPSFSKKSVPSIKERGIWSWGHCVYDYKKFFENMAKLKLNMAVIWNDEVPTNALEVINYAHSFGIKVYFGYAWGWDNKQNQSDYLTKEAIAKLKESCVKKYEETHLPLGLDGIYFQSFTETTNEYMGDKTIAEVVTGLVNEISGELLRLYPDLKIQFGLHALSTKNHLD